MSKNKADCAFRPLFIGEMAFSITLDGAATDNVCLSATTTDFCTFCVDKIVSKAGRADQSHWFISDLLPCVKMKQAVFYPRHPMEASRPACRGIFSVQRRLGASPKFCTYSVDKSVRNGPTCNISHWFVTIYFPCVNFEHYKINKKKITIAHQSFAHLLWITLCVTMSGWGKVLDP